MRSLVRYGVSLAFLAIVAVACGSGSDSPTETNLVTHFDVTAQPDVVVVEEGTVDDLLISSDQAKGEFRLRPSGDLDGLNVGDPVVLGGAGFGVVSSVSEDGDETILVLAETSLGEIIDTGTLEWEYDVSWSDLDVAAEETAWGPVLAVVTPIQAQTSRKATVSFTHQGWTFSVELEPKDDRLNFKLDGSHGVGETPGQASISAVGWVSGFEYHSNLEYSDGAPVDMSTEINGLEGEMELKWAAFRTPQQALTDIVKFNAPLSLPIPLPGPFAIPMTIQLKVAGRIVPELSALDASSGGSWKVTYSSDQGFGIDTSEQFLPKGLLKSDSIDTSGDTVSAGHGPVGFGLGVEFPRFELGFAGKTPFAFLTLDTYSTSLWTPGTTLTADIPPCQMGYTNFAAITGYELKALGWATLKDQSTLWEKRVDKFLDGEECSLTG